MRSMKPLVYLFRTPTEPDPYEEALENAGFRCRPVPVLDFELVNGEALRAALAHPDRYAGLILTSPRAAEALAEALPWLPNQSAAWMAKPVFAVGPRTSEALRRLGFQPCGEEAGSADALADVLERHAAEVEGALLFLCGDRRRETLPERLRGSGIAFEECVVYRTVERAPFERPGESPDWMVFFSPSGVEAVQRTPQEPVLATRDEGKLSGIDERAPVKIAAIGPTTAEALRRAGLVPDVIAEAPTPEVLAGALASHERWLNGG